MKKQAKLVLLAVMLVLMLTVSLVIASAATVEVAAGGDLAGAISGAAAGDTIKLNGDVTVAEGIDLNKDITIDGQGFKITFTAGKAMDNLEINGGEEGKRSVNAYAFNFAGGTVALKNVTIVAPTADDPRVAVFYTGGESTVELNNVITDGGWMTVVMNSKASITVDGENSFLGQNSGHQYVFNTSAGANGGSFELKNGTMSHTLEGELRSGGDFGKGNAENFTLTISGGTWAAAGDAVWIVGAGSTVNITGGTISSTAGNTVTPNVADGIVNISGGSIINSTSAKCAVNVRNTSTYSITGGHIIAASTGYAINASDKNAPTTCTIGGDAHISGTILGGGTQVITITGGTFDDPSFDHNARGKSIIFPNGGTVVFNISGGTFILDENDVSEKGTQIICQNQTSSAVNIEGGIFQVLGSANTGKALLISNGYVTINGGTFSHEGTGNLIEDVSTASANDIIIKDSKGISLVHSGTGNLISLTSTKPVTISDLKVNYAGDGKLVYVGSALTVTFENCAFSAKGSAVEIMEGAGATVSFNNCALSSATGVALAANGNAVTYTAGSITDVEKSPVLETGAGVRVTLGSQGIRFTSSIPANVVTALKATAAGAEITYGTLIAPTDMVVAAGAFTVADLTAYAAANYDGNNAKVFANVVAQNSLVVAEDGSIAFNAVLTNIKEANYDRSMSAISYAKIGDTYYYSTYNAENNARTMSGIVNAALLDCVAAPTGKYVNEVDGKFYRYTVEQVTALKAYLPKEA